MAVLPGLLEVASVPEEGSNFTVSLLVSNTHPTDNLEIKSIYRNTGGEPFVLYEGSINPIAAGQQLSLTEIPLLVLPGDVGGQIMVIMEYQLGSQEEKTLSVPVTVNQKQNENASVKLIRTFSATEVPKGGTVSITYSLYNDGNVTVDMPQVIDVLKYKMPDGSFTTIPNKSFSYSQNTVLEPEQTIELGQVTDIPVNYDVYSDPQVEYRANGTQNLTLPPDPFTVKMLNSSLSFQLVASKTSVAYGTRVSLVYTLVNDGNQTLKNIKVYDHTGSAIQTIATISPGQKVVGQKDVVVNATKDYVFIVKAEDELGAAVEVNSNSVKISMTANAEDMMLRVETSANVTELDGPGEVSFIIKITNDSTFALTNIQVLNVDGVLVGVIAYLEPGAQETLSFKQEFEFTTEAKFSASAKDETGKTAYFDSDAIIIRIGNLPDPSPTPTAGPGTTPGATYVPAPRPSIMGLLTTIFAVILVCTAATIIALYFVYKKTSRKKEVKVKMHRNVRE